MQSHSTFPWTQNALGSIPLASADIFRAALPSAGQAQNALQAVRSIASQLLRLHSRASPGLHIPAVRLPEAGSPCKQLRAVSCGGLWISGRIRRTAFLRLDRLLRQRQSAFATLNDAYIQMGNGHFVEPPFSAQ